MDTDIRVCVCICVCMYICVCVDALQCVVIMYFGSEIEQIKVHN